MDNLPLEKILKRTVSVLEESKKDIFSISESSRREYENMEKEKKEVIEEIKEVINELDDVEEKNKKARIELMEVSSDFQKYTEKDIKEAYKKAEEISVIIAILQARKDQLKKKRTHLEKRLIDLKKTVERAENLVSRMSVIKKFLLGELTTLSDKFEDLEQKNNLVIRVIQAQEEERRRVAREIHDGPAQSITNLVFRVELTEKLLDKDLNRAKEELQELKRLIRLSIQDVRKIIYNLRPMALDDLGLVPTLKRYINKYINDTNIFIDFNVHGSKKRLSLTYEVTIFRLVQEALNNIFKHAEASSAKIRLEYGDNKINLFIRDDGVGFNEKDIEENNYGLMSMEERCKLLGGKINIDSKTNKGTIIKVLLPLKGVKENNEL